MSEVTIASPDGSLELAVGVVDGQLTWSVSRADVAVVEPSTLRIAVAAGVVGPASTITSVGETEAEVVVVERPSGKQRRVEAVVHRRTIEIDAGGVQLALDVAAMDGAVAHRFRQLEPLGSGCESSTVVFPTESTKYVQPYDRAGIVTPASEALYSGAMPVDFVPADSDGWSLPALFETPGGWLLLSETAVGPDADGSRLVNDGREFRFVPPLEDQSDGPIVEPPAGPVAFPWKVMAIGDLQDIVATNAFEVLAEPTTMTDTDWIRPGRVSWSWWSESDSPRNPERLTDFIDFAAEVGWEYSLIDANWNLMPDGTIERLVAHGAERNVGIFLWYNSGGAHNRVTEQPRDRMDDRTRRREEMAWLREVGVAGLKVDFFHGDRASMNRLSLELLEDAAEFGLLMNFHGITSPKGWHATWPHLLTTEAVRGAEQYKFAAHFPVTAPALNTVLPFTRNAVGPMDYTPITLSDSMFPHETSAAHELALGVVFESGLQHPADAPEAYRALGAEGMAYLRALPAVWDEIRLLSGRPGDHLVLARRHEDTWWIGGLNGRPRPLDVTVDLAALGPLRLAVDGPERDDITYRDAGATETISMQPFGGFFAWPAG